MDKRQNGTRTLEEAFFIHSPFVCLNDTGFQVIFLSQITMKQIYLTRIQILAGHLTVCC